MWRLLPPFLPIASLALCFIVMVPLAHSQYFVNDKVVGVQLFHWKFTDIATECTEFLGPNGFSFVQTSPVQAHIDSPADETGVKYHWWNIYQPLSYNIGNRLGTQAEFENMVTACRKAGVDVIVDVVINHMACGGLFGDGGFGTSAAWSSADHDESFPDASYNSSHFHDSYSVASCCGYDSDQEVWNMRLAGLVDLATERNDVRNIIAAFLNALVSSGVVGFRVDAAKHMPLADITAIFSQVHDNYRGMRPFVSLEVNIAFSSDNTYKNYSSVGRILNYDYAEQVGQAFRLTNNMATATSITANLDSGAASQTTVSEEHSVVFVENHDTERDWKGNKWYALSRLGGMAYKNAVAYSILYPWGIPIVHSGYNFQFKDVDKQDPFTAPVNGTGYNLPVGTITDNMCPPAWSCQHRWSEVFPLVNIRNHIGLSSSAFLRSSGTNPKNPMAIYWGVFGKAFVFIGTTSSSKNVSIATGLPPGTYCNAVYSYASNSSKSCVAWPGVVLSNEEPMSYVVDEWGKTNVAIYDNHKSWVVALSTLPNGQLSLVSPNNSKHRATVTFKVTTQTMIGYGDSVYVTGDFNNWDMCNAVPCTRSARNNVWTCTAVVANNWDYQYKPIHFGSASGTACTAAQWAPGSSADFNAGSASSYTVYYTWKALAMTEIGTLSRE